MIPIESFAYDDGRTLVRAEYGYPKRSIVKEKSACTTVNTVLASAHIQTA
jgi:hypothetical protein